MLLHDELSKRPDAPGAREALTALARIGDRPAAAAPLSDAALSALADAATAAVRRSHAPAPVERLRDAIALFG